MIYPLLSLKNQISSMYQRPGFESLLNKCVKRDTETDFITDIYDSEIWKTFPSHLNNSDNSKQSWFFTSETADSHLGIMINLD